MTVTPAPRMMYARMANAFLALRKIVMMMTFARMIPATPALAIANMVSTPLPVMTVTLAPMAMFVPKVFARVTKLSAVVTFASMWFAMTKIPAPMTPAIPLTVNVFSPIIL